MSPAALFSRISPHYTFDFVDAPFESPPAPGIAALYPAPYLAWHKAYDPAAIQESHHFLQTIIDEDGPYDGVIGFSQGAALAASFLLCHEHARARNQPSLHLQDSTSDPKHARSHGSAPNPPFKVAVFLNSVMLFSPSVDIGDDISEEIRQQERKHLGFLQGDSDPTSLPRLSGSGSSLPPSSGSATTTSSMVSTPTTTTSSSSSSVSISSMTATGTHGHLRVGATPDQITTSTSTIFGFRPSSFPHRISIPTLHVIGKHDQFAEHSHGLVELCCAEKAEVVISQGGHEPPRTDGELETCAKLLEVLTLMASLA
ncbi:hypothetical protein A1O3_01336 [Capronia epimyces CBS 606.96]|uniref:Serine hydrolase domain-containing protein n=1 Tax=Capronia epimyces CBS 606.96 TaxID=1182542 RepID=W9ZE31_9EURO|nr:uncharacterized protein A1O3_01336 [Capronia epimyces CBS 606.96]EXJ92784.1 hypothetical protein A1O3_01336 [Capronia epimyces CBS 606.96]